MRLIDADEMIKNLKAMKTMYDAIELDGMIKGLEESKTVDAVPVVRCKDCKWYGSVSLFFGCTKSRFCPEPDFFCACGEKRDGGETHEAD